MKELGELNFEKKLILTYKETLKNSYFKFELYSIKLAYNFYRNRSYNFTVKS